MKLMKSVATAVALSLGAATFSAPAVAGNNGYYWKKYGGKHHGNWNYKRRHYGNYHRHRDHFNGSSLAFGLAAGAILGGALAAPRYYEQPRVVYRTAGYPEWYSWCAARYKSFNWSTGLYLTYHNGWQPCYPPNYRY